MPNASTGTTTTHPAREPLRGRGRVVGAAAALAALALVAYLPALGGGFVWDDDDYVTRNPVLRDADGLRRIWTDTSATPQYYPLTHTSFWLEYQLWGLRPPGYHAVNVALHAGCAVLLWLVLARLGVPGAWLGAALFAVHPVHVESVAWITERKNVLSGLFYLASARAYLGPSLAGPAGEVSGPRPRRAYALALVLFVLALLSKTVTATLPLSLAVVVAWRRGRPSRLDAVRLAPMVTLGGAFGAVTVWLERHQIGAAGAEWSLSLLERGLLAARVVAFYLGKLAWPADLTFIYPRWSIRAADPAAWVWPLGLAVGVAALVVLRRRLGGGPLAALAHFVIALIPALGFVNVYPMRYSYVADHFQYLASIGPLALAASAIWLGAAAVAGARRAVWVRAAAAVVLIGALGAATREQCGVYRDLETLWRDTLAKNPSAWAAHNNLGAMLGERGEHDEALEHLHAAIALKPDHAGAHRNLGVVLARTGRLDEAIEQLSRAVELEPDDATTRILLGDALARAGRHEPAREQLEQALRLRPGDPQANHLLGNVLQSLGRPEEAVPRYRAVLAKLPDDFATNLALGAALARLGRHDEALRHLERARRARPDDAAVRYNLALMFLALDREGEAARVLEQALRADPGFEPARALLERLRSRSNPPPATGDAD